jgi:23S rRNA U2552 (ribose-2'-O)-methylase RlmE/FtsJ
MNKELKDFLNKEGQKINKYFEKYKEPLFETIENKDIKYIHPSDNKMFTIDGINKINNNLRNIKELQKNITSIDFQKTKIKPLTEFLTRGVKNYVNKNKLLNFTISNAFIKLWEIYYRYPELLDYKIVNAFHMAEAPGQFINCTKLYTNRHRIEYNWRANSLKPSNFNRAKYEKNAKIFGDDYGLIKNNPDKWIFGADDTGDIINTENMRWFKKYLLDWTKNNNQKLNLVTGDAGIVESFEIMSKLDLSCMLLTLASSQKGSNCVIKHFLPFIYSENKSYESNGFYCCLYYSYFLHFEKIVFFKPSTSNPNSNEFYIIGFNFKGIQNDVLEKYYNVLDNYKLNMCWFNREDINKEYLDTFTKFHERVTMLNINQTKVKIYLSACLNELNFKYNYTCIKYMHEKLKKRNKIYKKWLVKHKLIK